MPNSQTAVIIVAAGRGSRMGESAGGPKQYALLDGRALIDHAVSAFAGHPQIGTVLCVIHPDDRSRYDACVGPRAGVIDPVAGGTTRQESVRRGLEALALLEAVPQRVLIHDAARPLVSAGTIDGVLAAIAPGTGALPAIAVADTIKRGAAREGAEGHLVGETLPREGLFLAQTPQGFVFSEILDAHRRARDAGRNDFTDDSAVAEWAGMSVALTAGNRDNVKITTAEDLQYVRNIKGMERFIDVPDIRTGIGYDVHRTLAGGPAILCGVTIDSPVRLDGHSDADVGLHALTDALLGCIGEGDIGSHFPPSDPQWKDAASDRFLAHACTLVRERGGQINHLDVTIICEAPKIGPHREAMRIAIAGICGMSIDRVSVKATTHERIGTLGRGEGIAAMATASVVMTGPG